MTIETTTKPSVLAARWVPEMSVSPNGMHEIRAGAVNARERPLIGYAATYADACEIAKAHNARATVERLAEALAPFAALLHEGTVRGHEADSPDTRPIFGINDALITLGDLRRANTRLAAFRGEL